MYSYSPQAHKCDRRQERKKEITSRTVGASVILRSSCLERQSLLLLSSSSAEVDGMTNESDVVDLDFELLITQLRLHGKQV